MNSDLKNLVERIDSLKSQVDSLRPLKLDQEQRLLQKVRLDWNFHSSHIEGNTLSYGETKALLLWGVTAQGKPLKDHLEIKGHNEAVEYVMDILKGKDIDLTEHFIREFHNVIIPEEYYLDSKTPEGMPAKRKIVPGQYKTTPNHVMTSTGEMFYFASPEDTPAKMNDLMKWYSNEMATRANHPLVIASMFHYRFVRIHPFDDGNGRMSRLLMNIILMKCGYPPAIINTELKNHYLNSLQYADADDYDQFIIFIGERLIESLELWLRAVKGESIEDSDDIDKMVSLLKKKIEWNKMDENVVIEKSVESIKRVHDESIKCFFKHFDFQMNKLNPLFMNRDCELWLNDDYYDIPLGFDYVINNDVGLINKLSLIYNYMKFIYHEEYSIKLFLYVEFYSNYYSIYYHVNNINNKVILTYRYHQQLKDVDIIEITNMIFKDVYAAIDSGTNKT